jgi:hypothetical protein
MIASEATWFFILMGLVVMTPISLIVSALINLALNLYFRHTWYEGFLRNSIVGLFVALLILLAIIFTTTEQSWLNGQPKNWPATLWENAGKISLVFSGIAVGLFHFIAKQRHIKSFASTD